MTRIDVYILDEDEDKDGDKHFALKTKKVIPSLCVPESAIQPPYVLHGDSIEPYGLFSIEAL